MKKHVLKKSMVLGSLMAFVITGSAFAAEYVCGKGESIIVDAGKTPDTNIEYRVMGGFEDYEGQEFNGNVTVNGGKWDMVVGGCYVKDSTKEFIMNIGSTNVLIKDGTFTHVVGGTAASSVKNIISKEGRTAHLVIEKGTFGDDKLWNENVLENLVIGGDHVKNNGASELNNTSNLRLDYAKTEIKGGEFNSLVIGGSLANQYYAGVPSKVLTTTVDTAETIITGGTFNKAIVAGGVAMGTNAVSNVDKAILNISNATVKADIFTAGMVRYADTKGEQGATVKESIVTIKNSTVENIYNTRGFAQWDDQEGWKFFAEKEKFPNDSGADDYAESSVTNLKLVNTTAEKVDVTEGSIELRVEGENGKTSVGSLDVGDGSKTTITASADGDANDAIAATGDYRNLNIQIGDKKLLPKKVKTVNMTFLMV